MKPTSTMLGLALGLVILGGLAFWDDWQTKKDEKADQDKNKVFVFAPDDVARISLTEANVEVAVERKEAEWVVTVPSTFPADKDTVENLLTSLKDYKWDEVVAEKKEQWRDFGLESPLRSVRLELKNGGKSFTYYVGEKAPVGFGVYFRTSAGDEKVYLGSQYLTTSTEKKLKDFRDKKIFSFASADVVSFKIQDGAKAVEINKVDYSISGSKLSADRSTVDSLLSELSGTRALDFPDAGAANGKTILIKTKDAEIKALLGKSGDKYVLTLNGQHYQVSDTLEHKMVLEPNHYADRSILWFKAAEPEQVVLDGQTYLQKDGNYYSSAEAKEPEAKVKDLLVDLEYARAEKVVPTANNRGKATHTLEIKLKDQAAESISLWVTPTEIVLRRRGVDLQLKATSLPSLNKSVPALVPPSPTP